MAQAARHVGGRSTLPGIEQGVEQRAVGQRDQLLPLSPLVLPRGPGQLLADDRDVVFVEEVRLGVQAFEPALHLGPVHRRFQADIGKPELDVARETGAGGEDQVARRDLEAGAAGDFHRALQALARRALARPPGAGRVGAEPGEGGLGGDLHDRHIEGRSLLESSPFTRAG